MSSHIVPSVVIHIKKFYNMHICFIIVDGGWSSWRLGPCSKTCGGGTQNYTRVCDNPKPSCGGKKCDGPSVHIHQDKCNDICCPGKIIQHSYV